MTWGTLGTNLPKRLGGSPEEGWAPEEHARFCADLCAVKRVAPLARLMVNQDALTPFASSVLYYFGQNGSGLLYAPTPTTNGEGDVTLTWPAYWEDEYGVQFPVKIRQAVAMVTSARVVTTSILDHGVRVRMFTDSGVAAGSPFGLRVW